ncbi:MAG: sulfite exporter TauE/SafE family protein [Gaiellaceae bacterium]
MSAPEAVGFAAWCFAVALAGGLVGLVLGNIRLPAVLLVAASPASAGGANIAISGVAAATASVGHIRAGRINWRLFAWMAPPSVAGAFVGGYLAGAVPDEAVLLGIAVVLVYSGVDLLRRKPQPRTSDQALDVRAAVLSGAAIGLLGGFVGLILGSLRMPALLRLVGETPARAVGTNLLVGVLVGIAGLLGHLPGAAPDLGIVLVGSAASIPGALLGARLTGRLSEDQLVKAIGVVLLVAGAAAAAQALA